jgi:beta-lactamase class A
MNIKCLLPFFQKGAYRSLTGASIIISALNLSCEKSTRDTPSTAQDSKSQSEANLHVLRSHGPKLVNKLLATDSYDESVRLEPLKSKVSNLISSYKSQNAVASASVFYMDLNTGAWFALNGSEGYTPGSLIKLPVCLSFFKSSELKPGVMERMLFYDPKLHGVPIQTYEVEPIKPGKAYSMAELIRRVLRDSDNYSTSLINEQIDYDALKMLYEDLDQSVPDMHDISYTTNVIDYSRFLQVLYNGTWLSERNSETALSYLAQSSFNEGLTKLLPVGTTVARKFGEYGKGEFKQWHESGIVYSPKGHYMITVMTKGYDNEKLRLAIAEISKAVYEGR